MTVTCPELGIGSGHNKTEKKNEKNVADLSTFTFV